MAKNWIRDLGLARGGNTYIGYMPETWMTMYHMLRCAGWEWVWECDGTNGLAGAPDAGHVPDGNMEAATASAFTAVGATIQKVTSEVKEGYQSLEITGQSPDTVETSALTVRVPQGTDFDGINANGKPTIIFTKDASDGLDDFYEALIGKTFHLSGTVNSENSGSFVIADVTADALTYSDADGINEGVNVTANWWIGVPIHVAMWVKNPGVETWNVDIDPGDGSDFNVGSFGQTSGGDWELLHFDFTAQGIGNITITFKPQGVSDTTIYVDSIMCYRSFFEHTNNYVDYADGDSGAYVAQSASDEFESSNYTFVADDVGKLLFIFDASGNHPKNTGVYTITGVAAGVATLDMRSTTAQLESQDGSSEDVNWRLVDVYKWTQTNAVTKANENSVFAASGFCLESPYNGWRLLVRGHWYYEQDNGTYLWAAPTAVDFDKLEGAFYPTGVSSQSGPYGHYTVKQKNWSTNTDADTNLDNLNWIRGRPGDATYTSRLMAVLDDTGKYFYFATNPGNITCTACLIGYVSEDAYHSASESFVLLSPRGDIGANSLTGGVTRDFLNWLATTPAWTTWGVNFAPDSYPRRVSGGLDGLTTDMRFDQSNAQANPFSGAEFIRPLLLLRDPDGVQGFPSERELSAEGVYLGRKNMTDMTVFGSDRGSGDGVDDKLEISGSTVTLTDNDGTPFTSAMIGHPVTIADASNAGNNGTFTITTVPTANTLTFENASGVTENPWSGNWSINMARYLHVHNGFVMDWPEEMVV